MGGGGGGDFNPNSIIPRFYFLFYSMSIQESYLNLVGNLATYHVVTSCRASRDMGRACRFLGLLALTGNKTYLIIVRYCQVIPIYHK